MRASNVSFSDAKVASEKRYKALVLPLSAVRRTAISRSASRY